MLLSALSQSPRRATRGGLPVTAFNEMGGTDEDDVHEAAPLASALLPEGTTCGDCANYSACSTVPRGGGKVTG